MPSSRLTINVQPRARLPSLVPRVDRERLVEEMVRVRVTASPHDGQANAAVESLLAEALAVPKRDVRLLAGSRSRRKVVEVPLSEDEALARLGASLRSGW